MGKIYQITALRIKNAVKRGFCALRGGDWRALWPETSTLYKDEADEIPDETCGADCVMTKQMRTPQAAACWGGDGSLRIHGAGPRQKPLRTPLPGGFTLIELLVVVLIVGVLAAVAVPQYQTAVGRARYQQLVQVAETLAKAQAVYYMGNATFPRSFDEMDISLGKPLKEYLKHVDGYGDQLVLTWKWGNCNLMLYGSGERIQCKSSYAHIPEYTVYKKQRIRYCHPRLEDKITLRICQSETGISGPPILHGDTYGYRYP